MLAALADGTLGDDTRPQVVGHVGSCQPCLDQVGALVRLNRVEAPVLPAALRERVVHLGTAAGARSTQWRAGLAVAAMLCLSFGAWFYTQTATSPMAVAEPAEAEQVRSRGATAPTPAVVRPSTDQRVAAGPVDVQWQPTASAIGYRVRVMRDDGTLVWEGESAASGVQVPAAAALPSATPLYVTVTALMPDGKTARSASVRFEIARE